jgi:hypothetical protein
MIWMMSNADWKALDEAWWGKSIEWKVSCAYILGRGPIDPSQLFLLRALQNTSSEVVREASLSLIRLKEREPEKIDIEVLKSLIELSERNQI